MAKIPEEVLLGMIANAGGGGGTSDYSQLTNKPQINGVTLSGDKSASDLGLASLDSNGKVPAVQLPSYVDDVVNGYLYEGHFYEDSAHTTEITGEDGKIYVDLETNKTYRWSGLAFVEISESLALGETASTAYAGDKGKANADAIAAIKDGQTIDSFADVESALANAQTLDGVVNPSDSVGEDKNLYIKLSGPVPSAMKVTSLKFEVTARRGGGSGMIEYSRLGFYDADGNKYNWPQGTTWSSNVRTAENDPIGSSKMLQYEIPAITTINLPEGEYIDTSVYKLYGWNTGNYTGENCQRDPVSWNLYLSEDKTNYVLRDVRSNQTITTSRNTLAFKDEFNTLPPEFPYISDIFYKKGGMWLKDAFAQQSEVDAIKDGQNIDSFADVESALSDIDTAINGIQDGTDIDSFADVETALALKQNATDNSLDTEAKTIVGAINENASDIDSLKSGLTTLDNEVNGDATTYPYADVITIEDAVPSNLADCNVKIEPIQDLHGYDKPWVGGAGKNKLPLVLADLKTANTDGTWNDNVYTINNGTITVNTDDGGNVTSIRVNGTFSSATQFILATETYMRQNAGTAFILNGCTGGSSGTYRIQAYKYNGTDNTNSYTGDSAEFTPTDQSGVVRIYVQENTAVSNVDLYPMLRISTETDTTFAPYTNHCPISGYTEASVQRDGRNLCDTATFTSYAAERIVNLNGVKVTPGTYTASFNVTALPSSDYRIEFCECSVATQTQGTSVAEYITGTTVTANSTGRKNVSLTVTEEGYLYIRCVPVGFSLSDIQIENGDTAHDYVPYAGKTYTIQLGDTIYGGTVDFDSGVMTVTHKYVDMGTLGWFKDSTNVFKATLSDGKYGVNLICSQYYATTNVNVDGTIFFNNAYYGDNKMAVCDSRYADDTAETFATAMDGVQLVYELATPTTIQLTPQQIQLLQGQNTLTASAGDISVTVNGVSGSIGSVQEQVNEIAEDVADVQSGLMTVKASLDVPNGTGINRLNITLSDLKSRNTAGTWDDNVYTMSWDNNITFTVLNDNGNVTGIKINGTPSSNEDFYLIGSGTNTYQDAKIATDDYILTGQSGNSSTFVVETGGTILAQQKNGTPANVSIDASKTYRVFIRARKDVSYSNYMVYPMIRPSYVIDDTYAPYIPSVESRIEAVESIVDKIKYRTIAMSGTSGTLSSKLDDLTNAFSNLTDDVKMHAFIYYANTVMYVSDISNKRFSSTVKYIPSSGKMIRYHVTLSSTGSTMHKSEMDTNGLSITDISGTEDALKIQLCV